MLKSNGKIIVFFGIIHSLFALTPFAFGKQFGQFSNKYFFKISDGILEFPLFHGVINYENFVAFWFFYFGLLLIPLGVLILNFEKQSLLLPFNFVVYYLGMILIGVYMIPFSGITIFMLPHALFMFFSRLKKIT